MSAFFPSYLRIIACDKKGNTVAASRPVPIDFDSPLGTAPRLYDLESDPAEEHNIAATHPTIVDELRARLTGFAQLSRAAMDKDIADAFGGAAEPMRESDVEALEARMKAIQESKEDSVVFLVERGIHRAFLEFEPEWDASVSQGKE